MGGRSQASRRSFSVSRSFNNLNSENYLPVGAMKNTSISPSPSNSSLGFNPYSKSEISSGQGNASMDKSPLSQRKGPIVKTVKKSADNEVKKEKEEIKKEPKKTVTPKPKQETLKKNVNNKLRVEQDEKKGKSPASSPNTKPKIKKQDTVTKARTNSSAPEAKSPRILKPDPEDKTDTNIGKSRTNSAQSGSKSPAMLKKKEKLEVKGKKMKTNKMPDPLTDKERFELLFEAYSKWGTDDSVNAEKGITALQVTRWLKNVEILDGKKVDTHSLSFLLSVFHCRYQM